MNDIPEPRITSKIQYVLVNSNANGTKIRNSNVPSQHNFHTINSRLFLESFVHI